MNNCNTVMMMHRRLRIRPHPSYL
uniref:Uncharacterized protein n=1 Tax=Arundo donax TaxID=35708 RepID=A0A0A9BAD6_ARUDO